MGLLHVTQFNSYITIYNLRLQHVVACSQPLSVPTATNGFYVYTQVFIGQEFKEYSIYFQDAVLSYILPTHESPKRYLLLRMPH